MDAHRLAEKRSLAYHRVVAERMLADPAVVERARERVRDWAASGIAPYYARAWERVLALPVERIRELLLDDTEEARSLRQATPFAGVLSPRERWHIWQDIRKRAEQEP